MRFLGGQPATKATMDVGYDGDDAVANYYGSLTLGFWQTSYFDATNNNSFTDECRLYNADGAGDIGIDWKSQTGHHLILAGVGGTSYYYFYGDDANITQFTLELSTSFSGTEVGIDISDNAISSADVALFIEKMYDAYTQGALCSLCIEGDNMPIALPDACYGAMTEIFLMGGGYISANYPETLYASDGGSLSPANAVGTYNRIGYDISGYPIYKHATLDWWLELDGSLRWIIWDRSTEGWIGYDPASPFDCVSEFGEFAGGVLGDASGTVQTSTGL